MRHQIFLVLGASVVLSACFLSESKGESPSTGGQNVDMSKPFDVKNNANLFGSYTVQGSTATYISKTSRCSTGGVLRINLDTNLFEFTAPDTLKLREEGRIKRTFIKGSSLENSDWYRATYLGDIIRLEGGKLFEVKKAYCWADKVKENMKFSMTMGIDTNSIVVSGCGSISYNKTINGNVVPVKETLQYQTNQGEILGLSGIFSANGKTCKITTVLKDFQPQNENSCKEAWNKLVSSKEYSPNTSWMKFGYVNSLVDQYEACKDSALAI